MKIASRFSRNYPEDTSNSKIKGKPLKIVEITLKVVGITQTKAEMNN